MSRGSETNDAPDPSAGTWTSIIESVLSTPSGSPVLNSACCSAVSPVARVHADQQQVHLRTGVGSAADVGVAGVRDGVGAAHAGLGDPDEVPAPAAPGQQQRAEHRGDRSRQHDGPDRSPDLADCAPLPGRLLGPAGGPDVRAGDAARPASSPTPGTPAEGMRTNGSGPRQCQDGERTAHGGEIAIATPRSADGCAGAASPVSIVPRGPEVGHARVRPAGARNDRAPGHHRHPGARASGAAQSRRRVSFQAVPSTAAAMAAFTMPPRMNG